MTYDYESNLNSNLNAFDTIERIPHISIEYFRITMCNNENYLSDEK